MFDCGNEVTSSSAGSVSVTVKLTQSSTSEEQDPTSRYSNASPGRGVASVVDLVSERVAVPADARGTEISVSPDGTVEVGAGRAAGTVVGARVVVGAAVVGAVVAGVVVEVGPSGAACGAVVVGASTSVWASAVAP